MAAEAARIARAAGLFYNVALPKDQTAAEMYGSALSAFSRIETLHRLYDVKFDFVNERFKVPFCFARRNPLVDEMDRFDKLKSNVLERREEKRADEGERQNRQTRGGRVAERKKKKDAEQKEKKEKNVPTLCTTNIVTDQIPNDLFEACYEVRYLTLEEIVLLALSSLGRCFLTNEQLKHMHTARQQRAGEYTQCSSLLFNEAIDGGEDSKKGWRAEFRESFEASGKGEIQRPVDKRGAIVDLVEKLHESIPFAKSTSNFWLARVLCPSSAADQTDECNIEMSYLHVQTTNGSSSNGLGSKKVAYKAVKIPAQLFNPEYEEKGGDAGVEDETETEAAEKKEEDADREDKKGEEENADRKEEGVKDPNQLHCVLQQRLESALKIFVEKEGSFEGRPEEIQKLFASKRRLEKFNTLLKARAEAFSVVPNQRAVSKMLIDAVHLFLDDTEKAMENDQKYQELFPRAMREWGISPDFFHYRLHRKHLAYTKGTESSYNEWEYDADLPENERAACTSMFAPTETMFRFYTRYFFRVLRGQKTFRGLLPAFGTASSALSVSNASSTLSVSSASSTSSVSNASGSASTFGLSAAFSKGWKKLAEQHPFLICNGNDDIYEQNDMKAIGHMLVLECEPLHCTDPSGRNDYGSLFLFSSRFLGLNPFLNFNDSVLNYVLGLSEAEVKKLNPEVIAFVELLLVSFFTTNNSAAQHIQQLIEEEEAKVAEAEEKNVVDEEKAQGGIAETYSYEMVQLVRAAQRARLGIYLKKAQEETKKNADSWKLIRRVLLIDSYSVRDRVLAAWNNIQSYLRSAAPFTRRPPGEEKIPFGNIFEEAANCYKTFAFATASASASAFLSSAASGSAFGSAMPFFGLPSPSCTPPPLYRRPAPYLSPSSLSESASVSCASPPSLSRSSSTLSLSSSSCFFDKGSLGGGEDAAKKARSKRGGRTAAFSTSSRTERSLRDRKRKSSAVEVFKATRLQDKKRRR